MFLRSFITMLFSALQFVMLLRVILSWISPIPRYDNPIMAVIYQITEPILAPIRRFATFGMMDFSPFIALVLLQIIESFLLQTMA